MACVGALTAISFPAQAQKNETPKAEAVSGDIFTPTSAWLVGPASLASGAQKGMPCVMVNQFNNGFLLRFSGGGQKLFAMAIDTRQPVFTLGQAYPVDLSMGHGFGKTVKGDAYDAATLLINLQGQSDLYKMLSAGGTLHIGVGGHDFEFAMLGAADGLRRMEQCFDPGRAQPEGAQVDASPRTVAPAEAPGDVDPAYRKAINGAAQGRGEPPAAAAPTGMHTISAPAEKPKAADIKKPDDKKPEAEAAGQPADDTGGMIDRMLKNATQAVRGNQEPGADSQGAPAATQTLGGGKPLAQSWTSPDIQRNAAERDIVDGMPRSINVGQAETPPANDATKRWRAISGNSLRDILTTWAQGNGVKLVWNSDKDFSVMQSVAMQGDFYTAVDAMLSQYSDMPSRPVGHVYNDISSNQKVLVIDLQDGR